jgi:uncharacterized Zn finger protein
MSYWDFYYEPTKPKEVKGGIKARSKRGAFATSWWGRRWIEILESFNIGARLQRGRTYARKGQVASLEIKSGTVTAKVQGSSSRAYKVEINVKVLSENDWQKIATTLARQAFVIAKLFAGEMPPEMEEGFQKNGFSLFPVKEEDLQTECSCPDWSNPCKHIAAVYYLLAEEFDRDPFLLFRLRGIKKDKFLSWFENLPPADDTQTSEEPLTTDLKSFWGTSDDDDDFFIRTTAPPVHAALPKRLGEIPFWRGGETFTETIGEIYKKISVQKGRS